MFRDTHIVALEIAGWQNLAWVSTYGLASLWRAESHEGEVGYFVHVSKFSSWSSWLCSFPDGVAGLTRDRTGRPVIFLRLPNDDVAQRNLLDARDRKRIAQSQLSFYVGHGFIEN